MKFYLPFYKKKTMYAFIVFICIVFTGYNLNIKYLNLQYLFDLQHILVPHTYL